jgi:hypothetical protein
VEISETPSTREAFALSVGDSDVPAEGVSPELRRIGSSFVIFCGESGQIL